MDDGLLTEMELRRQMQQLTGDVKASLDGMHRRLRVLIVGGCLVQAMALGFLL